MWIKLFCRRKKSEETGKSGLRGQKANKSSNITKNIYGVYDPWKYTVLMGSLEVDGLWQLKPTLNVSFIIQNN